MIKLYRANERLILARLEVDLIRAVHKGRFSRSSFAGEVELILISAVVLVGHVWDTPRNAAEVARFLGLPRATAQRKLATLVRRGICERCPDRRYIMVDRQPGEDYSYIDLALSLIRDAANKSYERRSDTGTDKKRS